MMTTETSKGYGGTWENYENPENYNEEQTGYPQPYTQVTENREGQVLHKKTEHVN